MSEKVFAYGSNMCSGRFRAYGVFPESDARAALLSEYRLRFNKRSQKDDSGKANVEPHAGGQVWGVLYTIPDPDLARLDAGEGGYHRATLPVRTIDGDVTDAWVYLASKPHNDPTLRPYTWYSRFLVEGAREHSIPAEYVLDLERIDAIQDANPQRDRDNRALACGASSLTFLSDE
jgi:hypothetical protein